MNRIGNFNQFRYQRDLSNPVSEKQMEIIDELVSESKKLDYDINESFLDDIKTGLSKFFLGDLSGASQIDKLREALLSSEIEYYDELAELKDKLEDLKDQKSTDKEIQFTTESIGELTKAFKIRKNKLMNEINRIIRGNKRLTDYYETGRMEDEYRLAQAKYEVAKNKSDNAEMIRKAKEEMEKAKMEAEKAKSEFEEEIESGKKETKKKNIELIDPEEEKKIIASKKVSSIIERKRELRKEIADLKADLENLLEKFHKKMITKSDSITQKMIENVQRQAIEIAVNIDSRESLLSLYSSMGKSEKEIEKIVKGGSQMSKISSKINQAINNPESNLNVGSLKKEVTEAFGKGKVSPSRIKGLINKISK
jgi:hypothetical protein